jgi:MoaA/NifB/PqqE/SkfB family radical SAM enzyme
MSAKFALRTLRNIAFRDHPYFAHLALTHRCNLRCRYCHIQEERFEELDTEDMKRVIDVLDRMGVGVLSVSGGGEPLLRADFAVILNYAASRGLYTKITSNGTMPLYKYDELLRSRVDEIGISLDGVEGNDLPFSHTGPRILETISHLNNHLPPWKKLTLNITVSLANRDKVDGIVAYCTREYPRARIWLNPVVTGDGKLRNGFDARVKPDYLNQCQSPTLLKAAFYTAGAFEQYYAQKFEWSCRAGRMFFDVKPNGDLWLCQDKPARSPLNVLDPDFMMRFKTLDVANRRECSGCTYSCYFLTQKGFEPKNWRDMAVLWWTSATDPGAPCRRVAEERGWVAGLCSFVSSRLTAAIQHGSGAIHTPCAGIIRP